MKQKKIRLTEDKLSQIILGAVKQFLKEGIMDNGYPNEKELQNALMGIFREMGGMNGSATCEDFSDALGDMLYDCGYSPQSPVYEPQISEAMANSYIIQFTIIPLPEGSSADEDIYDGMELGEFADSEEALLMNVYCTYENGFEIEDVAFNRDLAGGSFQNHKSAIMGELQEFFDNVEEYLSEE